MFVELHIVQNFAPANLNRDDTGAPKDCEFGGHRRARVSSQCLKRAIRDCFKKERLIDQADLAIRTKRAADDVARRLIERGRPPVDAKRVAVALLGLIKSNLYDPKTDKTQYLMFLGGRELDKAAALGEKYWDALLAGTPVPAAAKTELERALDGGRAADMALFGRMLADLPERNVDAACQVAHAISTNKVSMEMDFYTAVDDLRPEDTEGADMLGTVEFNSACFYRYANVDMRQLRRNLLGKDPKDATPEEIQGAEQLARVTLAAFLRASAWAVPSGKQNSMAAQNPPSLIMAVVRERGLWSLANAYVSPIWPARDGDLVQGSISRLDAYWGKLTAMYGENGLVGRWVCELEGNGLKRLADAHVDTLDVLVERVMATASFDRSSGGAATSR